MKLLAALLLVLVVANALDLDEYKDGLEDELLDILEAERNGHLKKDDEIQSGNDDDDDDEEELDDVDPSIAEHDPWWRGKKRSGKSNTHTRRQRRFRWRKFGSKLLHHGKKLYRHGKTLYRHVKPTLPYFAHGLKLLLGKKKRELQRLNDLMKAEKRLQDEEVKNQTEKETDNDERE